MDNFDCLISDSVFAGKATWESLDERTRCKMVSAFLENKVKSVNIYECVTEADMDMVLPELIAGVLSGSKSTHDLSKFILDNAKNYYRNDIDEALEQQECYMMTMQDNHINYMHEQY